MNFKFLRWSFIVAALAVVVSCGTKTAENLDVDHASNDVEQPIEIVVKKGNGESAHQAPAVTDVPAIVTPTPAPVPPPQPIPVPVPVPVDGERIFCGDGERDGDEECDDGNDKEDDECDNFCRKVRCGNNRVEGLEECDSSNHLYCTDDCTLPLCGNGTLDQGETCDPPNTANRCNATCLTSVCGNGTVEFGEACDDGNQIANDGCSAACQLQCPVIPQ